MALNTFAHLFIFFLLKRNIRHPFVITEETSQMSSDNSYLASCLKWCAEEENLELNEEEALHLLVLAHIYRHNRGSAGIFENEENFIFSSDKNYLAPKSLIGTWNGTKKSEPGKLLGSVLYNILSIYKSCRSTYRFSYKKMGSSNAVTKDDFPDFGNVIFFSFFFKEKKITLILLLLIF